MPSSRESSWSRDQNQVSYIACIGRWFFTTSTPGMSGVSEISSHPEGGCRGSIPQVSLTVVMRKDIWRGAVTGRQSDIRGTKEQFWAWRRFSDWEMQRGNKIPGEGLEHWVRTGLKKYVHQEYLNCLAIKWQGYFILFTADRTQCGGLVLGGGSVAGPTMEDMKLCWPLLYATKGDDTGGKWWLHHGAQSSMTSHNFRTSGTW